MSANADLTKHGFMGSIPLRVRLLIFTQILNTLAFGYFLIYLTAYLVEIQVIDAWGVGLVLGLETIVLILAGIPLGILSDRRGRKWLLILGNVLLPPTILIFALTHDFTWYLVGAAALYVVGIGLLYLNFRDVKPKG